MKLIDKGFDFTKNESFEPDRKKAQWAKTDNELNEIWRKRLKNEAINEMLRGKTWEQTSEISEKKI